MFFLSAQRISLQTPGLLRPDHGLFTSRQKLPRNSLFQQTVLCDFRSTNLAHETSYYIMADQINMGKLTLNDSQHAQPQGPNGFHGQERSAYIPPHARGSTRGPAPAAAPAAGFDGAPAMNGGAPNGGAWPTPQQK